MRQLEARIKPKVECWTDANGLPRKYQVLISESSPRGDSLDKYISEGYSERRRKEIKRQFVAEELAMSLKRELRIPVRVPKPFK